MDYLIFFLLGALSLHFLRAKPIKIELQSTVKTDTPVLTAAERTALEEEMVKEDPKHDDVYNKLSETIGAVNDIMGGSDR